MRSKWQRLLRLVFRSIISTDSAEATLRIQGSRPIISGGEADFG